MTADPALDSLRKRRAGGAPSPRLVDFLVNTVPYAKQEEAFAFAVDESRPYRGELVALVMEQRTGKTPVALGKVAYEYERGNVDALSVVAMPGGAPRNWADEIDGNPAEGKPARLHPRVTRMVVVWDAGEARKAHFQATLAKLLAFDGLAVLLTNGEAVLTDPWRKFMSKFVRKRRVFGIVDETSLVIKSPGNKRTKILNGMRPHTRYRLITDGTPAHESPLDLYSQFGWLSHDILGQPDHQSFKHYYSEWEMKTAYDKVKKVAREYPAQKVDEETGEKVFRHMDEMKARVDRVSFICKRTDCFDIPDKVARPYHYELEGEQARVYWELKEEYESQLSDGSAVTAQMVLTRYLRLQQVLSNFWPSERELTLCDCGGSGCEECDGLGAHVTRTDPRVIDPRKHARLEAASDVLSSDREPAIVWARFTKDVEDVMERARELGRTPVRYDGKVSKEEKHANKAAFQTGRADTFVANQKAAERAVDLSAAKYHLYYSNTFSGLQRAQTEDRTEVSGRAKGTGYVDLVARFTIDEDLVLAHTTKRALAEIIMGRPSGRRFGGGAA